MKVSGRYLKYVRDKYNSQKEVNIMDIFKLKHFDLYDEHPIHDTFNCIVAGATDMPDDTKEVWVKVMYTLCGNLHAENIQGKYSTSQDAIYINLDDFIPTSVWG
jgi:hypothetical protein